MKAVLLLCVLVFLNFSVTSSSFLSCLCCGEQEETNALEIFLGQGPEAITLDISEDCWLMPQFDESVSKWLGIKNDGQKYEIKKGSDADTPGTIGIHIIPLKDSCRVGLDNSKKNVIHVVPLVPNISELPKDFKECPSNGQTKPQFQSSFLLFVENKNTFMFLDSNKAWWFFTSELEGCDMFVAIDPTKPANPLVIHTNANIITDAKANLEHKGNTVDKIMTFVPGYQLKARVYRKSPSPDVSTYMETYKSTHTDIKNIMIYDNTDTNIYFFGHYTKPQWHFYIRASNGGKTYEVL